MAKSITDKIIEKVALTLVGEAARKFSKELVGGISDQLKQKGTSKKARKLKKSEIDDEEDALD